MMEFDLPVHYFVRTYLAQLSSYSDQSVDGSLTTSIVNANPGPPEYTGDILENLDQVWAEDKWDDERVREAEERIKQQGGNVSAFWREKYENHSGVYWHEFYKRNTDNFYKDRHYIHVVFPELQPPQALPGDVMPLVHLLEVGSGVGNAVLPLLEIHPSLRVHALDIARSAINILRAHPLAATGRLLADVCDIVTQPLPSSLPSRGLDFALCMFVLSAMAPQVHQDVFRKLSDAIKPGGKLLIRDYARYDEAQLRFAKGSKIADNFYVRQDGTCSYFFSLDDIHGLAAGAGMEVEECYYIQRQYANRKQLKARYRVWLHAKLVKMV